MNEAPETGRMFAWFMRWIGGWRPSSSKSTRFWCRTAPVWSESEC